MESGTRKVLSYDEIVLYECDIEPLFRHGGWLTDNMVNFAANYLKNKILGKDFDDMVGYFFKNVDLFWAIRQ